MKEEELKSRRGKRKEEDEESRKGERRAEEEEWKGGEELKGRVEENSSGLQLFPFSHK